MKMVILLAINLIQFSLFASPNLIWNKGCVTHSNGKVISGEISYSSTELILFKREGKIFVYNPYQIRGFSFLDENLHAIRKYSSVKIDTDRIPLFYESVVVGEVSILRAPKSHSWVGSRDLHVTDYQYFVCWKTNYKKISDFKSEVLPSLIKESPFFEQIIQDQRLSPSYFIDVVNIVRLFNNMKNSFESSQGLLAMK